MFLIHNVLYTTLVDAAAVSSRCPECLQRAHEGHEILLLRFGQLRSQHEVEELDRILERQQPPIVQVRRASP